MISIISFLPSRNKAHIIKRIDRMIKDKIFKSLKHSFKNYYRHSIGIGLEIGYRPDYVLKRGNNYIILESENSSSRKTYVGGLIKAAHFLRDEKKGRLIFIIVPKDNTKAISIAMHLKPYLNWIQDKTNLRDVYVVEASKYYCNETVLSLDCSDFYKHALKV